MGHTLSTKDYILFSVGNQINLSLAQIDRGLPGDEMELTPMRTTWKVFHRTEHPQLVGVLDVMSKYVYGMSSRGVSQYLFTPYNKSYPPFIVGCADKDRTSNKIVVITFASWDNGQKFPKGSLINTLGCCGDLEAEAKALQIQHSPWNLKTFTLSNNIDLQNEHRLNLCGKPTLNIDPEGCKDIDDIITVYRDATDFVNIVITIADVSELVDIGGIIDKHAQKTGQTLYSEFHKPRNMLPSILSEDALSLVPGKKRLGVSLCMKFISLTNLIISDFRETIVENNKSYTYDNVKRDAPKEIITDICYAAKCLGCKSLDDPHKWIETFMLHYNKEVAKKLNSVKLGIFRGQPESMKDNLETYKRICPELAHEAAIYVSPINLIPHYSLNCYAYCYASSPIRRYVDIVNQRYLKSIIRKEWDLVTINQFVDFETIVSEQNALQKGAKAQSRDDFLLKQIATNPGKILDGVVFSFDLEEEKIKVYVPQWKRFVKVRNISQEYSEGDKVTLKYYYNPNSVSWKKRIVFETTTPTTA